MKDYIFKKEQWFFEKEKNEELGLKTAIKIEKKIYFEKTPFQDILVLDTKPYGRTLILDGYIQLTEKDEFIYHEMITHPVLFSHPAPKTILIVGGGDGGTLREVLRHNIKRVFLCEIDKRVIEISKKYLPFLSQGSFRSKKLSIFIKNGLEFIKKFKNFFDIIIVDVNDPENFQSQVSNFFNINFLADSFYALKSNGLISIQSGYLKESFFKICFLNIKKIFPFVKVHRAFISCFPEDEHAFIIGSKKINLDKINLRILKKRFNKLEKKLNYYSPEIHLASSILPQHIKNKLDL